MLGGGGAVLIISLSRIRIMMFRTAAMTVCTAYFSHKRALKRGLITILVSQLINLKTLIRSAEKTFYCAHHLINLERRCDVISVSCWETLIYVTDNGLVCSDHYTNVITIAMNTVCAYSNILASFSCLYFNSIVMSVHEEGTLYKLLTSKSVYPPSRAWLA